MTSHLPYVAAVPLIGIVFGLPISAPPAPAPSPIVTADASPSQSVRDLQPPSTTPSKLSSPNHQTQQPDDPADPVAALPSSPGSTDSP